MIFASHTGSSHHTPHHTLYVCVVCGDLVCDDEVSSYTGV